MELKILTQEEKTQYRGAILALLEESDEDFLPPLSRRRSTKDQTFSGEAAVGGILSYYEAMNRQEILAAAIDGELLGFVSFYENFEGGEEPSLYVSTLVVAKAARGHGLTSKMYAHLFYTLFPEHNIYTRTWSTNAAHTKILARFGFAEWRRLPNDRGPGIDTVYFARLSKVPALSV